MKNGWEVELASRCLFYLLRIHQNQIVSNQVVLHTMDSLRINTRGQIKRFKVYRAFGGDWGWGIRGGRSTRVWLLYIIIRFAFFGE